MDNGGFGTVHRGKKTSDGSLIAVKFSRDSMYPQAEYAALKELAQLNHANIVKFYGVLRHFWEGQDKPEFGLVFEWCGIPTTPLHLAKTMVQLRANLSSLVLQTAEALEFMHAKGFIHRDIKPQNVLVAIPDPDAPVKWEKAVAKLADFATVKRFINLSEEEEQTQTKNVGTSYF
jgi:serine/threonine-protein kinase